MSGQQEYQVFVGTYTRDEAGGEGVYCFDVNMETGRMKRTGVTPANGNPSFLCVHPDGDYLYAVNQVDPGTITAFVIDSASDEISELNCEPSGAPLPNNCTVDATGRYLLASHSSGSVSMLSLNQDGTIDGVTETIHHRGSSVDPDRQQRAYPHSVNIGPENRFVYVPDLGADRVVIYEMNLDRGELQPASPPYVSLHPGAGPRHFDIHPKGRFAYLINELDSTVTAFERNPDTGALKEIQTVDTLPESYQSENSTADVHVHPSGQWVYGSNRGHDSIVHFEIEDNGGLAVIGHESTHGEWPRNFALGPEGRFLYAENQDTGNIVLFRISTASGSLEYTGYSVTVPQPVCMKFRPIDE